MAKIVFAPGYPLPDHGSTSDPLHCPRCGSEKISTPVTALSGQKVGVCHGCGHNYVIQPISDQKEGNR